MDADLFLSHSVLLHSSSLSSHPHLLFYPPTPIISRCAFLLLHSPVLHHLPPLPKPCPPLALCLLSVNSFFLLLVCRPRLTYFSLYLCFSRLCLHLPSIPPSLLPFWETRNRPHMCTVKYMHVKWPHTRTKSRSVSRCFHDNPHTHVQCLSCYQ